MDRDLLPAGDLGRTPQPGAHVSAHARPEPEPLPANPWVKWGWAFASIWLVFLVYPVIAVLDADVPAAVKALSLLCILGFAVSNVLGYARRGNAWLFLGLMLVLALATLPVIGIGVISYTPYLAMLSALELPSPGWKWAVAFWAAVPLLSLLSIDGFPPYLFLMLWPIMLGGVMLRIFGEREHLAHEAQGAYALVAERERVARDVHDVLGHSLTALSVKAELAARLIDIDPARAKEELESIQATARQALAEVRATVGGLRAGNLEAELPAAPLVLADAGISASVVGTVADTDPRHRALMAWVLRESVTNVVRHARADAVVIELGTDGITVTDDGEGCSGAEGNGLRGMRERVAGAGGTLEVTPATPGTRVRVALP
ncbi:sensor histidine kinase [Nocardioides zhouii]|uniref:Sensor histidine kinase n=1 Tax=Nocardioides zhouii TaxID=1168729 RepID=A0A4Q2ST06_9ACTN|nr:sensor histidine kinase [Nocardioides zhouii]RYC07329.1 sensor histidine kinase [Nocardioides zhouii]